MQQQEFKYFAFISYNSKDTEWGKRLQRKLESYRMPATLCSEHGWTRTPIKPVFFAPTDIQPNYLSEELQERLRASRNLIVICSTNSAKSKWVGEEIAFFHKLGRTKQIHFFIVEGEPHSGNPDTECFNPIIDTLGLPEILGANIHEKIYRWPWLNKERAYVQLISKLLGVEFDAIWQRHRRLLIQKAIVWTIGVIAILAALIGVWINNQPVDVEVRLNEASVHNSNLPPLQNAVVTISLDNETKTDTIRSINLSTVFNNIPHYYINKKARLKVEAKDFLTSDTVLDLSNHIEIDVYRDAQVYGDVHFRIWHERKEQFVSGVSLGIAGKTLMSDENGWIRTFIPLESQQTVYQITSSVPLERSLITLPCGPDDVVLLK